MIIITSINGSRRAARSVPPMGLSSCDGVWTHGWGPETTHRPDRMVRRGVQDEKSSQANACAGHPLSTRERFRPENLLLSTNLHILIPFKLSF